MGTAGGSTSAIAALRYRNFAIFWSAALVSNTGTWCQGVAVPFVVFHLTRSPAWVGVAAFAQFLPMVLLGPLAGSLADRFPRRRILFVTQTLLAASAIGLWGVWVAGVTSPGVFIAAVAVNGAFGGINITAWQAFVTELVPRDALTNAITLNSAQFNASRAFGPALGGVVLVGLGPGWAFLLNAVSYIAVIVALVMIDTPDRSPVVLGQRPRLRREFASTMRYVAARPGIATCVAVVGALGLVSAPLFSLLVVFAEDVFKVEGDLYGLLAASLGIGSLLATPLVAGRGSRAPRGAMTLLGLIVYGLAVTMFGLAPSYWLGVTALLLAGGSYLTLASTLNSTLHLLVDDDMRGKVVAVYLMMLTAAAPVGALGAGLLADWVGPRPTIVGGGIAMLVYALFLHRRHAFGAMDDPGPEGRAASPPVSERLPAVPDELFPAHTAEAPSTTGMPAPGA
jgi:MFS family permease